MKKLDPKRNFSFFSEYNFLGVTFYLCLVTKLFGTQFQDKYQKNQNKIAPYWCHK